MRFKEISVEVSKAVLESFEVESWAQSRPVIRAWHVFFFSLVILLGIDLVAGYAGYGLYPHFNITFPRRVIRLVLAVWILLTFVNLAVQYYRFLLLTGKDLKFGNIMFFFFGGMIFIGFVYGAIYYLQPSAFIYSNPLFTLATDKIQISWRVIVTGLDFILYAILSSFTLTYYRIQSASVFVSFVNACSILYSVFMVSAFLSTFVQKTAARKDMPSTPCGEASPTISNADDQEPRRPPR